MLVTALIAIAANSGLWQRRYCRAARIGCGGVGGAQDERSRIERPRARGVKRLALSRLRRRPCES
jgi:hypothetical protein